MPELMEVKKLLGAIYKNTRHKRFLLFIVQKCKPLHKCNLHICKVYTLLLITAANFTGLFTFLTPKQR